MIRFGSRLEGQEGGGFGYRCTRHESCNKRMHGSAAILLQKIVLLLSRGDKVDGCDVGWWRNREGSHCSGRKGGE